MSEENRVIKFALFKHIKHGWEQPCAIPSPDTLARMNVTAEEYSLDEYVRVTNIVEIEFILRTTEEILPAALHTVEQAQNAIREKALKEISAWEEKKKELLLLTGPLQKSYLVEGLVDTL